MNAWLKAQNGWMTLSILLALGVSLWLMRQSLLSVDETNISQSTTPDAYMVNAKYTSFDAKGHWTSRIDAVRVTHYPDQDTALFESPKMIALANNASTWEVIADHGTSKQDMKVLYLLGHVVVDRIDAIQGKNLTLNTSALTTWPKQKFAQTDQPVIIIQPGSVVHAIGLTADMNTGDIHLLSQVHGTYQQGAS